MISLSQTRSVLHRYCSSLLVILLFIVITAWPTSLAPLARAYIAFCARVFTDSPLFHHYPPYVVAILLLVGTALILGALFMLARQIIVQRQITAAAMIGQRSIDDGVATVAATAGLSGRLVVIGDSDVYAFCSGLLSPRVYISDGLIQMLTASELDAVLRHEAHHMRRRDPLRLLLTNMFQVLISPLPVVQTVAERCRIKIELAADRVAREQVSLDALASALIKVARTQSPSTPRASVAGLTATDARVAALLGKPINVPFDRRDLIMTAALLLTFVVVLSYLATLSFPMIPFCDVCPPY